MVSSVKRSKQLQVSCIDSVCGQITNSCKKKRVRRLQGAIAEHFDERLDIRSFVRVHTSLNLLLNTLLNKQQKVCFQLSKAHAVAVKKDSSSSDSGTSAMMALDSASKLSKVSVSDRRLASLVGYPVETAIDRKLVQGVFDTVFSKKAVAVTNSTM